MTRHPRIARFAWTAAALTGSMVIAGCTGSGHSHGGHHPPPNRSISISAPAAPKLTEQHPCPDDPRFSCATLPVPLDHTGAVEGSIGLQVQLAPNTSAPKGVLVLLTGGPGQYGSGYAAKFSKRYPAIAAQYQWVSLDVRGTGGSAALDCPQLQQQIGSNDIAIPTLGAVRQCASLLGARATLYATSQTVADLDDLRRALGVSSWTLDGVSYGSYVAERYALAHQANVTRLVLDSVVPHAGPDPLNAVPFAAFSRVFGSICSQRHCPSDPVAALRTVLAGRTDAATVSDAILDAGIFDGSYQGVPELLDQAAHGNPAKLNALLADRAAGAAQTPYQQLNQASHASALCADIRWPWRATDPPARRAQLMAALATSRPAGSFGPFSPEQAAGNGFAVTCENWPSVPAPVVARELPPVPVLLLGGSHDLSTPIEWLQQEAAVTPDPVVKIFANTGHSQQRANSSPALIATLNSFLLG